MSTKIVNLSLPEELLKRVDAAAKREYSSRSDFVRKSLYNQLRTQTLSDEYQEFIALYNTTLRNLAKDSTSTENKKVLKVAKTIIERHKQDFENLANR